MTVQEEDTEMQRPRVGVVPGINEQTTVTTEAGVQWLERAVGSHALSKGLCLLLQRRWGLRVFTMGIDGT